MGFLFGRVMRFYAMGYEALMQLPLRAFWFLSGSIDRLAAEEDLRALTIASSVQSGEAYKRTHQDLLNRVGTVAKYKDDGVVDHREGIKTLKRLARMGR